MLPRYVPDTFLNHDADPDEAKQSKADRIHSTTLVFLIKLIHFSGTTPLLRLPIDMIQDFACDTLHCADLGIIIILA